MLRPGTFALTALLAGLTAVGPLTTDMYLPSLPDIARQLQTTTAQAQLTLSAYLIGFAIGQIVYGPISDRHGRKPVLMVALALYVTAAIGCALSESIEALIGWRLLQGIGGSGGIVLARAIVRDLYSGPRAGREMSMMASVMALAPALAPLAGGVLQMSFGWRSVFITLICCGLAGATTVWLLLPETLKIRAEKISPASIFASYRVVVRNPVFIAYLGISASNYSGLFAWISGGPFVLQDLYGLSPFDFGLAFAFTALGFMAASTAAARLVTRIGLDGLLGVGAAISTVGGVGMLAAVALGGASAALWLTLTMTFYLFGLGFVLPQAIAGAMTPLPERAGAASSVLGFGQQGAAAAAGAIVGWALGATAWPLAIAVAVTGVVTLGLWFVTRKVRLSAAGHA